MFNSLKYLLILLLIIPFPSLSNSLFQKIDIKLNKNIILNNEKNVEKKLFNIFDLNSKYVVNFWATWCKPCVAELPWFEQLHKEMTGQPVKVVLVSMDFPKQFESKLLPFVQERQLKATVIALADMDYNSWIDKVSTEWDGAIPFTLIYKNDQRQIKLGELDSYEELKELVGEVRTK